MMNVDPEMSTEELDEAIDAIASDIVRRRLETPAILFLESHKPLSFITSQALVVGSPLLGALVGIDRMNRYSNLFSSVDNIEKLIRKIEELVAGRDKATTDTEVRKDMQTEQ